MLLFGEIKDHNKVVVITESQQFDLLLEAASLQDIYSKYYSSIPQEQFTQVVQSDPTWREDKPDKMGKYGKWLLALYQKGNLKLEDLYKANEYLRHFMKYNSKITPNDITKYGSLQQLYTAVEPFISNPQQAASKSEEVRNIKQGAEKVYEDGEWLVIVPHTKEASCYYGKGTQWCTAAEHSNNMFQHYSSRGDLYINILKGTDIKYQFHFESQQFMDATDREIKRPIAETIGLTEELVSFYEQRYKELAMPLRYEYTLDELNGIRGLNGYYTNELGNVLLRYNTDAGKLETVCKLENYLSFLTNAKLNRFIPLGFDTDFIDIYDVHTDSFLFDKVIGKKYIRLNANNAIVHYENDTQSVFSLEQMRFTCEGISEDYNFSRINQYGRFRDYPDNLSLLRKYGGKFCVFSMSEGKPLTDFIYTQAKGDYLYYQGKEYSFLTMLKGQNEYFDADVLLYDGTVVPMPQLAQSTDQILSQHMQKTA